MTTPSILDRLHAVTAGPTSGAVILSGVPLCGTQSKDPDNSHTTATAKGLSDTAPATVTPLASLTPALIHPLFPFTPLANIAANLPPVLAALTAAGLTDRPMLLAALATIRAEAEPFLPLTEAQSRFNTSPGAPAFNLYDHRAGLGNQGPPDGVTFRGRGYVQLTGRANYARYGTLLSLDLLATPSLAAESEPAARILAAFLSDKQSAIRAALAQNDLARARRLVNGGSNGLDRFTAACTAGLNLLP